MTQPHPIPYQGSKRNLANVIGLSVPQKIGTWYEPFAGSAAMALWAAENRSPQRIVLGDSLGPLIRLWAAIVNEPHVISARYAEIWVGQRPKDRDYFNQIRERFNQYRDPVDLLYLLCRCVKNAVRFNTCGNFTQSVDQRRLGRHPDRMRVAIERAAHLLRGRTEFREDDWLQTLTDAEKDDFIYMDPPYLGTSTGRDRRYAASMSGERLLAGLRTLSDRKLCFALSYDGMCGDKSYGPPLPDDMRLTRRYLNAGRSSQATLNGINANTIESLYLSETLENRLGSSTHDAHAGSACEYKQSTEVRRRR